MFNVENEIRIAALGGMPTLVVGMRIAEKH
jgi:hypothetical protein